MSQRYPSPITAAMVTSSNANVGKPRYNTAGDWAGGVVSGEDPGLPTAANEPVNTARVAIANSSGGANEADYVPRTQNAKRTAGNLTAGTVGVTDITRPRGYFLPGQAIFSGTPAAPTVTSVTPASAAAGSVPLVVKITGTNFFNQTK